MPLRVPEPLDRLPWDVAQTEFGVQGAAFLAVLGGLRARICSFVVSVVTVDVPPLRERLDNIPELVRSLVRASAVPGAGALFTPAVMAELASHQWPGNVRELRNYVERAIVLQTAPPARSGTRRVARRLSAEVLVPQAVFHEVVVTGAGLPGAAEVESATWITAVTATRADLVKALMSSGLHRGESEAITVAVERGADCVLIDERQGRLSAEAMGLAVVGSIGILIAAKARGDIKAIGPLLAALRTSGLWLSESLVARVLLALGEQPDGQG